MLDVSARRRLDRIPTWALLVAGALCLVLSVNRIPVPLLGWLAPTPLLVATTRLRTWRGRGVLLAVCLVAGIALGTKVVTEPIPPIFGAMFGAPIGGVLFVALVAWDRIQRRSGPVVGLYAFAALMVLNDYLFAELSPGGDWGAIFACTQIENLPLLQLASRGGLGLITFVVVWPAAAIAGMMVASEPRRLLPHVIAALGAVVLATAWGSWRLDAGLDGGPTLSVAAVTVDGRRGNVDLLFERSELAARRGAQLVVWNEIATLVDPPGEPGLHERGARFAAEHHVDLVMAYGVVRSRDPFSLENKYEWFGPGGETLEVYHKHFIVPGDPNVSDTSPLRVLDRPWGKAAGAICYDYDAPWIARAHARGGAGIVVLPSSDWRGIDPYHTLMARVRAIEGGMSVVRATRASTSMAFDAYGRIRASMPAWEANDHVMLATVPTTRVATWYSALGNWPVVLGLLFVIGAVGLGLLRGRWR